MLTRRHSVTILACTALVVAPLLACKKKSPPSGGSGSTGTTSPAATATAKAAPVTKTFNVGDTATQIDYKLSVHNVKECKPSRYQKAKLKKAGHMLLGVELTIEAISDKQFNANSYNMKIVDGEGLTFKASYSSGCTPKMNGTTLNKGEKAKGWVTFEVPTKGTGLKLSYQPTVILGRKQITKFDLGR